MKIFKRELLEIIKQEIIEVKKSNKKKREAACPGTKGSPWHGLDGKFVDPDQEAGSWSRRYKGAGKCKGQSRRPSANRKQVFTKVKCGRDSKYKCSTGEAKWKRDDDLDEADGTLIAAPSKDRFRTQRRDALFPGTDGARKLAYGVFEALAPVMDELFAEGLLEQPEQRCFTPDELKQFKERIIRSLWIGISNYQKAADGEFGEA